MKKAQRVAGQILFAVGITLALGGISSFFFETIELRFPGGMVTTDAGRAVWVAFHLFLAASGLFLWRPSRSTDSPA